MRISKILYLMVETAANGIIYWAEQFRLKYLKKDKKNKLLDSEGLTSVKRSGTGS